MQMKKKLLLALVTALLLSLLLVLPANAYLYEDFGFHRDSDGLTTAEWNYPSTGINFSVKLENYGYETVSEYTLYFSAQDRYGNDIQLYASDGKAYDTIYITNAHSFSSGRVAMSWACHLRGTSTIGTVMCWVESFKTKDGTHTVQSPVKLTWNID